MGRGQLKYRKRGGRGGPPSGGRGQRQAGRDGAGSGNDAAPAPSNKAKRRGGEQHSTSHLPSNTERWGLSFGEDNQGQGRRTGLTSSSAVSFEETERLLDQSEWATGASSWRLGAATAEEARDEGLVGGAAAASSELLSLNLDMLEKCLRRSSVYERLLLRLPHTYTAELEVDVREDPALEPADKSPTRTNKPGGSEAARAARVGGGGAGGAGGGAGERERVEERAGKEAWASTTAPDGGARVVMGGDSGGGTGADVTATVEGDEDGVLDALLDLPATGAGAVGSSSRAGETGLAASNTGRTSLKTSLSPTSVSPGNGHGHDDGRGEDGVPTRPAGAARSGSRGDAVGVGIGGSDTDADAKVGGHYGDGGADELEDWLDDMLADP